MIEAAQQHTRCTGAPFTAERDEPPNRTALFSKRVTYSKLVLEQTYMT